MALSVEHLQIVRISAENLKDVARFSKMATYAVIDLLNDPRGTRRRTLTDREGQTSPTWNCSLLLAVPSGTAGATVLRVLIRSEGLVGFTDQHVGTAEIHLNDLKKPRGVVRCAVRRPSGRIQGTLSVTYQFVKDQLQLYDHDGEGSLLRSSLESGLVGGVVGGLVALVLSGGGGSLQTGGRRALEPLLRVCGEVSPLARAVINALRTVLQGTPPEV